MSSSTDFEPYPDGYQYMCQFKSDIGWVTARPDLGVNEANVWKEEVILQGYKVRIWRRPVPTDWERVR
jgi:hypothetical protein